MCNRALRVVEALGDLSEFFQSQVVNPLLFRWRDLAFLKLGGSLYSDLQLSVVHHLVQFFISFVAFLGHYLASNVGLKIFNFGRFPGVTEVLHRLQRKQLLLLTELSVLTKSIDADNKLDGAALIGLCFDFLPNLWLYVVSFALSGHLLSELFLMPVVGFLLVILYPEFFVERD